MTTTERAVLAGGCFWGAQELLRHKDGIISTRVGYSGDDGKANATYRDHGDHAEAVEIVFDPDRISYRDILEFFFQIHDPSTKNRQGNDVGPQYRSAIFYKDDQEKQLAEAFIADVNGSKAFKNPIVTTLEPLTEFYPAEAYHQNFLASNPDNQYIALYDRPKLDDLKRLFPDRYRETPVLVAVGDN